MKSIALIGFVAMGALAAACAISPAASATPTVSLLTSTPATLPAVVTPPTSESSATPTATLGGWSLGAGMIAPYRSEMPVVELDRLVYVPGGFGGESRLERYDPIADEWQALADMPAGRHHVMATAYDGDLFVFGGSTPGGFNPTDTVWQYDPRDDVWTDLGAMPERRMSGAAMTIGEKIYVVGGVGDGDGVLEFTPSSGEWRTLPGGNAPRDHANTVAFDGKVWLIGGRGPTGETSAVEIFDPATETWSDGPSLNVARAGFAAAVVQGQIMVAGGEVIISGRVTLDSLEIFDPAAGTWRLGPALPHPVHGVGGAAIADRFLLPGGSSEAGAIVNEGFTQIYAP